MFSIPGRARILVSGNLVQDIVVCPVSEIRFGGTFWVERLEQHMGGNGANTAYAAALLGAHVRLLGMVGDDPFGAGIRQRLATAGVDLGRLETGNDGTAASVVLVRPDGARAFLHRPGVSREAFQDSFHLTQPLVDGCAHYHLANPFSLVSIRPIAGRLLAEARALGLTTSLDTAWDSRGEWMKVIEPCLPHLNLLFVNEDEARILTGCADHAMAAAAFLQAGVESVVVKLGERGCELFEGEQPIPAAGGFPPGATRKHFPAYPVSAVDTTGAGDCFVGGFLAGLQHGFAADRAAHLANAAGSLSVTAFGSTTALLPLDQTLAFAGL